LFSEVYAFVIGTLNEPFERFKQSSYFVEMEDYRHFQRMMQEVLEEADLLWMS
jgi:hypothetical protein